MRHLTEAEEERLSLLTEECSEVIKIIQKIKRFGWYSCHPRSPQQTNKGMLAEELGHLLVAYRMGVVAGDVLPHVVEASIQLKNREIDAYLQHQTYNGSKLTIKDAN